MQMKPIALLLCTLLANAGADNNAAHLASESKLPHHEALLAELRRNERAIAPQAKVHPVSATYNREAIIPPQCYTRTEGRHNPCYVCHQEALPERENVMNDAGLQAEYSFSDLGFTNHWQNLFEDRSERVAAISDHEIKRWIAEDNYTALAPRLRKEGFKGWIPDLENLPLGAAAFDEQGFALDGSFWVAFNYKPMPSTFWPTNGSTDDVMIRLPEIYRSTQDGKPSRDVYIANLAILEANLKGMTSITTPVISEVEVGKDLNDDGKLTTIEEVSVVEAWVGAAHRHYLDTHLYPQDTEFLHTVRYVNVDEDGGIGVSRRMKEVRYMRKYATYGKDEISRFYQEEAFAKDLGHLPGYNRLGDHGLDNGMGWAIQGFIEGADGALRTLTYEENLFCMGCHNSIGSTIDKTFSFPRKVDGALGWGYINLRGMPDAPNAGEQQGEILTYLQRVGGGGEFRSNPEMQTKWFKEDGTVNAKAVAAADVYELITPSAERAIELNKAYRVIVADQDFIYGRDATATPPDNVYDFVNPEKSSTLPERLIFDWDIRLAWPRKSDRHESVR